MTTSTLTARKKGDPQHYVEGKNHVVLKEGHKQRHEFSMWVANKSHITNIHNFNEMSIFFKKDT